MILADAMVEHQTLGLSVIGRSGLSIQQFEESARNHPAAGQRPFVTNRIRSHPHGLIRIVEADRELRQQLSNLLRCVGYETRCYTDFDSFLKAGASETAGCLVLDATTAPSACIGVRQLAELGIDVPVVMIASRADVSMAVQAMKSGAIDFLEKPLREEELLEAVAAANEADRLRRSARSGRAQTLARYETLSRRERQVMMLVTEGLMNKQVAWELGLSEITVKVHRGSAMRKMAARSLTDLVRMADAIAKPRELAIPMMVAGPADFAIQRGERTILPALADRVDAGRNAMTFHEVSRSYTFRGSSSDRYNAAPTPCRPMA